MKEFDFIKQYLAARQDNDAQVVLGIGDDAAIIRPQADCDIHISSDMLLGGRHFFTDVQPADLAHKVLAVNLSDMAAMGATPKWATLSVALPQLDEAWVQAFCDSLFALADAHGLQLVGGDTTRGDWVFNVTIMGQTPQGLGLRRDAAQVGDDVWVSGRLGLACAALFDHWNEVHLDDDVFTICEAARLRPQARVALGQALLPIAHAAQDVSDGFAQDLQHILTASHVGAVVNVDALPTLPELKHFEQWQQWVCAGGDDYELVFTAPASAREAIMAAAASAGAAVSLVGKVVTETGLRLIDAAGEDVGLTNTGFDHFE